MVRYDGRMIRLYDTISLIDLRCNYSLVLLNISYSFADPCHTRSSGHMYEMAFEDIAEVGGGYYISGSNTCRYNRATSIDSLFPDQYVTIDEGCTAQCTGCTFKETEKFSGPVQIDCLAGRCSTFTRDTFNCGDDIELASDSHGMMQTLLHGQDAASTFAGFEGVNSGKQPISLPPGCSLECSGCSRHVPGRTRNMVGKLFTFMNGV